MLRMRNVSEKLSGRLSSAGEKHRFTQRCVTYGFYSRLSCLEDPDRCTAVICDKDNVISIRGRERIAPDALFYEVVPDYSVGFSVKEH